MQCIISPKNAFYSQFSDTSWNLLNLVLNDKIALKLLFPECTWRFDMLKGNIKVTFSQLLCHWIFPPLLYIKIEYLYFGSSNDFNRTKLNKFIWDRMVKMHYCFQIVWHDQRHHQGDNGHRNWEAAKFTFSNIMEEFPVFSLSPKCS